MYEKILIAVAPDHTESLPELLRAARALALPGGSIEAVSVVEALPNYLEVELPRSVYEDAVKRAQDALDHALANETDIRTRVLLGSAAGMLEQHQSEGGHDLIVLRSHKPVLSDWVLGSTAARIVRRAPCSVHVIR